MSDSAEAMVAEATSDWRLAHTYRGSAIRQRRLVRRKSVLIPFLRIAETYPGAPFLSESSNRPYDRTISYRAAATVVRTKAGAMAEVGIAPGTRVGLLPHNDAESFLTILAVMWAGGIAVLASPADSDVRSRNLFEHVSAVDYRVIADNVARARAEPVPFPIGDPDSAAVVVFTSGSTGLPRAVAQSGYGIAVNCRAVAAHHRLRRGDRIFACLPISHVNALEFTGFAAMTVGCHIFLAAGFDPFRYLRDVSTTEAMVASVVPSILATVAESRGSLPSLRQLRYFVSAAAPLSSRTVRRVGERLSTTVVHGYGMSEAGNFSCSMPIRIEPEAYRRLVADADIPAIGGPLFGNEVVVLRSDDSPAELGEVGEIAIRGHNLMLGYVDDPAATRDAFRGGWLRTGDLGTTVRDRAVEGDVLVVVGREKNIVKIGGHGVGLEEVERVLTDVDGIAAVAACAVADDRHGEALAVFVVPTSDHVTADEICALVVARMGPDYLVRHVCFVDALPLLPNGKLRRSELAAMVGDRALGRPVIHRICSPP